MPNEPWLAALTRVRARNRLIRLYHRHEALSEHTYHSLAWAKRSSTLERLAQWMRSLHSG